MGRVVHMGIDVGSTTVKLVVLDENLEVLFSRYQRHYAEIREVVVSLITQAYEQFQEDDVTVAVTGSGGIAVAEHLGVSFVQEVIAGTQAIQAFYPQTDVVIELGGEDAKITFLRGGVEQRMNGICAGGTGAFIDQMAVLMRTDAAGLNELAKGHRIIYPIAARCGVFAKSDIQPLLNDGAARRFHLPGGGGADGERPGLRPAHQGQRGLSRRPPVLPLRAEEAVRGDLTAQRWSGHLSGELPAVHRRGSRPRCLGEQSRAFFCPDGPG